MAQKISRELSCLRVLFTFFATIVTAESLLLQKTPAFRISSDLKATHSEDPLPLTSLLLKVAYDGGPFSGWSDANDGELLKNSPKAPRRTGRNRRKHNGKHRVKLSVQGRLRGALAKIWGNVSPDRIIVEACSRTDKGVHARGQVCQIYCLPDLENDDEAAAIPPTPIAGKALPHPRSANDPYFTPIRMPLQKLSFALNRMLPDSIRILKAAPVPSTSTPFHATLSSESKTYRYLLATGERLDPTRRHQAWYVGDDMDLEKMKEAALLLQGKHDYKAWQGAPRGQSDKQKFAQKSTECTIKCIEIKHLSEWEWSPHLRFYTVTVCGDRFLYKMVRNLVGTMVAVGTRKISGDQIQDMYRTGERVPHIECAPAHGLVLENIEYQPAVQWEEVNE